MTNPSRHAELLAEAEALDARWPQESGLSASLVGINRRLAAALTAETARHDALRAGVEAEIVKQDGYIADNKNEAVTMARMLGQFQSDLRLVLAELAGLRERGVAEPDAPGGFIGDIWFGHPEKTTFGTHRWNGEVWEELPSELESVLALLTSARTEAEGLREKLAEAEKVIAIAESHRNLIRLAPERRFVIAAIEGYRAAAAWGKGTQDHG